MSRRHRIKCRTEQKLRRGTIWLVVDNRKEYDDHVQGGTRTCIIVSNNTGNWYSPNVEVVFTTTRQKSDLPTHFQTCSTPKPSTVLCEEAMTVSKKKLIQYYGSLSCTEILKLNRCLRISLGI